MQADTTAVKFPQKNQLCTHHVGSGRKEDRGILGSVNTARLAQRLRGVLRTDLESAVTASPVHYMECFENSDTDSRSVLQ